ncbi:hypothetical protein WA026_009954 [Henosepilachna vigintioctopunctata]|uniref:Integrase catalytic domain-containing protein n=1 Tax=Henosepilachna vigintioctopunctata TaxID=420089 RepID=A0AAW1TRD2_9CUCU
MVESMLSCRKAEFTLHSKFTHCQLKRFDHVHLDIVVPLPSSEDTSYYLTMTDEFIKWPEAILITDITADTIATKLYENWILLIAEPSRLTTDQGRQFKSNLLQQLAHAQGIQK